MNKLTRRQFLKLGGVAAGALIVSGCSQEPPSPTPTNTSTFLSPTPVPSLAATARPARALVTLPGTESWNLVSKINGQEYRIFVGIPNSQDVTRLPVIYLTDGNGNFPLAYTLYDQLVDDQYVPPAILVGVDFPFDEFSAYQGLRVRDFTPTAISGDALTGGAPAFYRFLCEELKPLIDSKYRTLADDATLVGHSLGGLFTLYALFQEPAVFQRYVVGSPSIWWDGKAILSQAVSFAGSHDDLAAHVFMGVGANEGDMVTDLSDFAKQLAGYAYPGLGLTQQIFEAETHLSVIPFCVSKGLRAVWG